MKYVLLILTIFSLIGCHSGKDPKDDFEDLQQFIPEYEEKEVKVFNFDRQYGIDPDSLIYTHSKSVQANAQRRFKLNFELSGPWSEKYDWELIAENDAEFSSMAIESDSDNKWTVNGRLAAREGQTLYLKLNPKGIEDPSLKNAAESMVIEPITVIFND